MIQGGDPLGTEFGREFLEEEGKKGERKREGGRERNMKGFMIQGRDKKEREGRKGGGGEVVRKEGEGEGKRGKERERDEGDEKERRK